MTEVEGIQARKTPWRLWVVGIVALLWSSIGAMDYVMTETRNAAYLSKFTPEQLAFFEAFPSWLIACWAIAVWGGVVGAILLLLRKGLAVPVFLASFVAMVVTTLRNDIFTSGWDVVGSTFTLIFSTLIFFAALGFWLYACAMKQRGVIR